MRLVAAAGAALLMIRAAELVPRPGQGLRQPPPDGGLQDLRQHRQGRGRRCVHALLDRSRAGPGQAAGLVQQGLPQDQDQLRAPAGRRALRQGAVGASGQVLPGRRHPDLRHGHDPRLPEARRLPAVHLAGDGRLQARVQERARGLLDLGVDHHGRHRLQPQQRVGRRGAQDVGGPARSEVDRRRQRQGFQLRPAARRLLHAEADPGRRLLQEIRRHQAARLRFLRPAVRPPGRRPGQDHHGRAVLGLHRVQGQGRAARLRLPGDRRSRRVGDLRHRRRWSPSQRRRAVHGLVPLADRPAGAERRAAAAFAARRRAGAGRQRGASRT